MSVLSSILTYWYISHHQAKYPRHETNSGASVLTKSRCFFLICCNLLLWRSIVISDFLTLTAAPALSQTPRLKFPALSLGEIAQFCRENCLSEFIQLARELQRSPITQLEIWREGEICWFYPTLTAHSSPVLSPILSYQIILSAWITKLNSLFCFIADWPHFEVSNSPSSAH